MFRVMGIAAAAALAGLFVTASPASAQDIFSGIEVGNVFQVTGTVTTTTGVTSTADLTGTTGTTTTATTTDTTSSGSVLLPATGADLSSSTQQVTGTTTTTDTTGMTGTVTTTTGVTSTSATTDTTTTGSVLLPQSGADLSQQQRNVSIEIVPLLMLLAGIAMVAAVALLSMAKHDHRQPTDDQ